MVRPDPETVALIRLSARITAGTIAEIRVALSRCADAQVSERWLEELILQSYLFSGLPRALNAAREWRRFASPTTGTAGAVSEHQDVSYAEAFNWRMRGEATCARVYGANYEKLRLNIRALLPVFDEWMIVEGYGKVLSRPGLDLVRRELCIVAACVASGQDRQLRSHLRGALNSGAAWAEVDGCLTALEGVVDPENLARARLLWNGVARRSTAS